MVNFNLSSCHQVQLVEYYVKAKLYKNLNELIRKDSPLRFASPVVGGICALLTVAKRVGLIAENALKGITNIIGFPFFSSCNLSKGLDQLIVQTIKNAIYLPFSIISAGFDFCATSVKLVVDPVGYSKSCWFAHDPLAKKTHLKKAAQKEWDTVSDSYQKNSSDVNAIKFMAKSYYEGSMVVVKDSSTALDFYDKAARLGDLESILFLGNEYKNTKNYDKSIKYFDDAAKNHHHIAAMTELAKHYSNGWGTKVDHAQAYKLYSVASDEGCIEATFELGKAFGKGNGVNRDYKQAADCFRKGVELNDQKCITYLTAIITKLPELRQSGETTGSLMSRMPIQNSSDRIIEASKDLEIDTYLSLEFLKGTK